jgi:hypothetical protein
MKSILFLLALGSSLSVAYANPGDPFQASCNSYGDEMGGNHCSFACAQMCEVNAQTFNQGSFTGVDRHQVAGTVKLESHLVIENYLALESDFQTTPGPDLRIVLRDSKGQLPDLTVATLDQTKGKQKYILNSSGSGYDEVVIHCAKYNVDFGVAKLGQN